MNDDTAGSNRLAVLGAEIMDAHKASEAAKLTSVQRAKDAGAKLNEAKKLVRQAGGKWLPWLKTVGLPDRTAQLYMRMARLSPEESARLADLGLEAAMNAIAKPRRDEPEIDEGDYWDECQLDRKTRAEAGECVVASMRAHDDGQRIDEALLRWAEDEGRLVRVDRQSEFGNPFVMPDDGDRGEVIAKFEKFYWPHKPGLLDKIVDWRGKVLVCWCHPEACHADVIANTVNAALRGEGTPQAIADQFADIDG